MIKITRDMRTVETIKTESACTQVSLNSDGCLTLRKYDHNNKEQDEIVIFTQSETQEIVKFFKKLSFLCGSKTDELPF